jgi:hypothetical protein
MITLDPLQELLERTDDFDILDDCGFPEALILIRVAEDTYACINTSPDPVNDPTFSVNAIVAFLDEEEATIYKAKWKMSGTNVNKTFQEARKIAIAKETIQAIAVQRNGTTFQLHYVR